MMPPMAEKPNNVMKPRMKKVVLFIDMGYLIFSPEH